MCRRFDTIPACDGRTDGQTDGIAVASTALAKRRAVKIERLCSTVSYWATPYAIGPLSCLPVALMYSNQTVGLIKMKLGTEVGLGPGHIVRWGPSPNFRPTTVVAKRLDGSRCHLVGM